MASRAGPLTVTEHVDHVVNHACEPREHLVICLRECCGGVGGAGKRTHRPQFPLHIREKPFSQRGLSRQPQSWLGGSPGHGRCGKEHGRHVDSPPSFTSSPLRLIPLPAPTCWILSAGKSTHRSARTLPGKARLPFLPLGWEVTFLPHLLLKGFFLFLCF